MNTTVNGPEPELLPSRVEHDVHEQRGHGRQRVRVQAGHAEHVAGTRQGVNDGTGHLKSKQTAQFTNRKHKQEAAVMLVRSPGVWKVNRDSIKLHFFVFWGVFLLPTEFWLYKTVGDSQIVGGDGLSVDNPQQSELGRQRVHDHGQVSLPNLRKPQKDEGMCERHFL